MAINMENFQLALSLKIGELLGLLTRGAVKASPPRPLDETGLRLMQADDRHRASFRLQRPELLMFLSVAKDELARLATHTVTPDLGSLAQDEAAVDQTVFATELASLLASTIAATIRVFTLDGKQSASVSSTSPAALGYPASDADWRLLAEDDAFSIGYDFGAALRVEFLFAFGGISAKTILCAANAIRDRDLVLDTSSRQGLVDSIEAFASLALSIPGDDEIERVAGALAGQLDADERQAVFGFLGKAGGEGGEEGICGIVGDALRTHFDRRRDEREGRVKAALARAPLPVRLQVEVGATTFGGLSEKSAGACPLPLAGLRGEATLLLGDAVFSLGRIEESPSGCAFVADAVAEASLVDLARDARQPIAIGHEVVLDARRVLTLAPGSVIELPFLADEPWSLFAEGWPGPVAKGELVVVDGERFGLALVSDTAIADATLAPRPPDGIVARVVLAEGTTRFEELLAAGSGSILQFSTAPWDRAHLSIARGASLPCELGVDGDRLFVRLLDPREEGGILETFEKNDKGTARISGDEMAAPSLQELAATLASRDPVSVLALIQWELPQTIALILSLLDAGKAAWILQRLPRDVQGETMRRYASMDSANPEMVGAALGVLVAKLDEAAGRLGLPGSMGATGGVAAAVAILCFLDRASERGIIEALEEEAPELAEEIKKRMFVFEDIVLLDDRSIQKILREIDGQEAAKALKGVDGEVQEKIFKNMSKNAAKMLKEDMDFMGPVRIKDVEEAQQKILAIIRHLEETGEIIISRGEGDELVQ